MSSRFNKLSSYPKPAHVCRAPIPGRPQPPASLPGLLHVTLLYEPSTSPDDTPRLVTLTVGPGSGIPSYVISYQYQSGETLDGGINFDPLTGIWSADLIGFTPAEPLMHAVWSNLQANPAPTIFQAATPPNNPTLGLNMITLGFTT